MAAGEHDEEAIRTYVEAEAGEEVVHAEKAASERVGPVRHDIWDVHCADNRWWVVTNPTNLYDQRDFKEPRRRFDLLCRARTPRDLPQRAARAGGTRAGRASPRLVATVAAGV